MAPWYPASVDALIAGSAGSAAFLMVLLPALIAPAHRLKTALVACGVGCVAATYVLSLTQAWFAYICAVAFGGVALWAVTQRA